MSKKISVEAGRTACFERNSGLESLLREINSNLWISEKALLQPQMAPQYPLILLMGPMRSGTTLLMQWLANTNLVAYPSNLLSRFYQAPIIGAKIQLLITDRHYNFRDELGEFFQQAEYHSENGKTKGVLAPNEFWYFWRRFLADPVRDVWTDDELCHSMDTQTMLAELAGIMQVFQKPFAAKGMLFNYNIPLLDSLFEKILFVQLQRDPVTNVASVLAARKRQLGSDEAWYSFNIPEYEHLQGMDPINQSAGQVHFINRAVTRGLEQVHDSRKMLVCYEEFCERPQQYFEELCEKLGFGSVPYAGPEKFQRTRVSDSPDVQEILKAVRNFENQKE